MYLNVKIFEPHRHCIIQERDTNELTEMNEHKVQKVQPNPKTRNLKAPGTKDHVPSTIKRILHIVRSLRKATLKYLIQVQAITPSNNIKQ